MSNRIKIFNANDPQIGLFTRPHKAGQETDLVNQFIDYYSTAFLKANKNNNLAVFVEPQIASGFPDIVFAVYLPSILKNWTDERINIDTNDLKVLTYLCHTGGADGSNIITRLRLPDRQAIISLEKLLTTKIIEFKQKKWQPRPLRDIFSIVKLISVEAKISHVSRVMDQSLLNTWFASQSYALTCSATPQSDTLNTFSRRGIGLYCKNKQFKKVIEAKCFALPSSYLSFKFNEWIGNSLAYTNGSAIQ